MMRTRTPPMKSSRPCCRTAPNPTARRWPTPDTFGSGPARPPSCRCWTTTPIPTATSSPSAQPPDLKSGALSPIYGSTGFQIAVPADKAGSETFKYTVDDGRGLSATADVALNIVPPGENSAPRQKPNRNTTLVVQAGKSVTQNILTDWIDPDGDDLFAVAAASRTRGPGQDPARRPTDLPGLRHCTGT